MSNFQTILIPTKDMAASRDLFRGLLGVDPSVDESYYVGFDVDGQHIGFNPQLAATTAYLHVDDMDAAIKQVIDAGGEVLDQPKDVSAGRLVATVRDASGAEIGLICDPK